MSANDNKSRGDHLQNATLIILISFFVVNSILSSKGTKTGSGGGGLGRGTKSILKGGAPSKNRSSTQGLDGSMIPSEPLSTIVGRLIDIDSLNEPITSDEDDAEPITYAYRTTTAAPMPKHNTTDVKPDIHSKSTGQPVQIRG